MQDVHKTTEETSICVRYLFFIFLFIIIACVTPMAPSVVGLSQTRS